MMLTQRVQTPPVLHNGPYDSKEHFANLFKLLEKSAGGRASKHTSDGVYMWRLQGIDAGEFSRSLMDKAANAVRQGAKDAKEGIS
eukprot:2896439-Pyramimonas_sp.AAC.2